MIISHYCLQKPTGTLNTSLLPDWSRILHYFFGKSLSRVWRKAYKRAWSLVMRLIVWCTAGRPLLAIEYLHCRRHLRSSISAFARNPVHAFGPLIKDCKRWWYYEKSKTRWPQSMIITRPSQTAGEDVQYIWRSFISWKHGTTGRCSLHKGWKMRL